MALWLARQCQDPPTGWACPTDSTTNCVCNASYYGPGGDLCTTCDAGSWCPGGATITACPANANSASGSDEVTDCVCIAGYYVHAASLTCSGSCPCSPSSGQRSGTIRSNDGSRYGNYESCTWVISGTGPSITFSAFSTESCCDYVYVEECYDSACSGGATRLAKLSGSASSGLTYQSATNHLRVRFTSDRSTTYSGFQAEWNVVDVCSACEVGTYKTAVGSGDCLACPANTISGAGSDQLTDCVCIAGYYGPGGHPCEACPVNANSAVGSDAVTDCVCNAGYYGPGGDSCTACDAGSWCPGGTTITACPAISTSAAGSDAITDCVCNAGYTAESDGMACSACTADTYKAATGTGGCSACPANANSAAGSDAVTDCVCNAGYYGPGGDSCATCDAGSWCPGGATITPCPDHMISAPGSDSLSDCTCKEGYSAGLSVEGALCEATDVSREVSTITLAVTLSMSASEFNSQMRRSAYIDGVARALKVESSAVQIKSVQEQSSERRRRLLATTCLVETTVTVTLSTPFLGMQATCFGCGFH